ncbi:MAG: hypothetical protein WCA45_01305, partial [Thiobacillaceae bacterium]
AAFRRENQQSMYLGFSQLNAPKPALLLGVSEKCASKVSKSGQPDHENQADRRHRNQRKPSATS